MKYPLVYLKSKRVPLAHRGQAPGENQLEDVNPTTEFGDVL